MSDLPNGIPALIEKKMQEERKLIADWLRNDQSGQMGSAQESFAFSLADKIKRGEYRKGEGE